MNWLDHPARNPRLLADFEAFIAACPAPLVLELGARRWNPEISTLHREWLPAGARLVGTDLMPGPDVDVVADAHRLTDRLGRARYDAVIAVSVFEHLERPWLAAREIAQILRPGGQTFVYTHFAFPEHGFPSDYWRFTRSGLELIFRDAGYEIVASDYENPARIHSEADPDTANHEVFTGVRLVARRPLDQAAG